jgi:hypothetical protein
VFEPLSGECLALSEGHILSANKSITGQAAALADDDTSQGRKVRFRAILLNGSQKVANARRGHTARLREHFVSEDLAMPGGQYQDAPKLLSSLFSGHK